MKKNIIVLTLPEEFENIPITIARKFHGKNIIISETAGSNIEKEERDNEGKYVFVYAAGYYTRINYENIVFIEANGSYCFINMSNGKKIMVSTPLSTIAAGLPDKFQRIHRSFVLNLDYIEKISGNRLYVEKRWFTIGREHRDEVFSHFIFFHTKKK